MFIQLNSKDSAGRAGPASQCPVCHVPLMSIVCNSYSNPGRCCTCSTMGKLRFARAVVHPG